jgi:hypothetical protein
MAAKKLVEGVFVMAQRDSLEGRQKRSAGQRLTFVEPREQ